MIILVVIALLTFLILSKPVNKKFKYNKKLNKVYKNNLNNFKLKWTTPGVRYLDYKLFSLVVVDDIEIYLGIFNQFYKLYSKESDTALDVEFSSIDSRLDEEINKNEQDIDKLNNQLGSFKHLSNDSLLEELNQLKSIKIQQDKDRLNVKHQLKSLQDSFYLLNRKNEAESKQLDMRVNSLNDDISHYTSDIESHSNTISRNNETLSKLTTKDLDEDIHVKQLSINNLEMELQQLSKQQKQLQNNLNYHKNNSPPLTTNLLPSQLLDDYE